MREETADAATQNGLPRRVSQARLPAVQKPSEAVTRPSSGYFSNLVSTFMKLRLREGFSSEEAVEFELLPQQLGQTLRTPGDGG